MCGELQTQLARHLMRQHKDEQEVKSALTLPRSERLRKINDIKKKGIFSHNIKLKKDGKALMRERSPGSTSLTMCLGCKGFYCKRRIAKHKKNCEHSIGVNQGSLCTTFLKESTVAQPDDFEIEILQKFRDDPTGQLCKTDSAIIKVGRKLWAKSARKDRHVIMNDMRTYGNLLLEVQMAAHDHELTDEDILKPENFEHFSKAIKNSTVNE